MKRILLATCSLFLIASGAMAQQHLITPRLQYVQGKGIQAGKFEAGGLGLQYQYFRKDRDKLGFVVSGDWHIAGTETKEIDLSFGGRPGSTDVNYTSTMNKLTGGLILAPLNGSFVSPYLSVQGGFLWYRTKFYINDPTDIDNCRPETNRNVKMSFALASTVESGIKVRLRKETGRQMYIQAGVAYTHGSKASYIKLSDEPDGENTQVYTSKFKTNFGTHAHPIGSLYRTRTSQLAYSLGLNIEFN